MSEGEQVVVVVLAAWGGLVLGAGIVCVSIMVSHHAELERWKRERQRHE